MKKIVFLLMFSLFCTADATDVSAVAKALSAKIVPGTNSYVDANGFFYSRNELAHLAKGELVNGKVAAASECKKAKNADPAVALKAFQTQLNALGIRLLVVPVPPKAAVIPPAGLTAGEAMAYLKPYYEELRKAGLEVVDLSDAFAASAIPAYCRTDAHWSPAGVAIATEKLAEKIHLRGDASFAVTTSEVTVSGDLAKAQSPQSPQAENLTLNVVSGKPLDEKSPVLLLGDSHTLFLSTGTDMLAENAGFAENLAAKLKMPVDRIGVKGSASTAVRINLFRKAAKDPAWIEGKKMVIYCFSCREFTESVSGWVTVPVLKK